MFQGLRNIFGQPTTSPPQTGGMQTVRQFLMSPRPLLTDPQAANPVTMWLNNLGHPDAQVGGVPAPRPAAVIIATWNRATEMASPIGLLWNRPKNTTTAS